MYTSCNINPCSFQVSNDREMLYISYFPKLQGYQSILSKALAQEGSKIDSVYTSVHTKFFICVTEWFSWYKRWGKSIHPWLVLNLGCKRHLASWFSRENIFVGSDSWSHVFLCLLSFTSFNTTCQIMYTFFTMIHSNVKDRFPNVNIYACVWLYLHILYMYLLGDLYIQVFIKVMQNIKDSKVLQWLHKLRDLRIQ